MFINIKSNFISNQVFPFHFGKTSLFLRVCKLWANLLQKYSGKHFIPVCWWRQIILNYRYIIVIPMHPHIYISRSFDVNYPWMHTLHYQQHSFGLLLIISVLHFIYWGHLSNHIYNPCQPLTSSAQTDSVWRYMRHTFTEHWMSGNVGVFSWLI